MDALFTQMAILIEYPWLAFVLGLFLGSLGHWRRRRVAVISGSLWLLYGLYETGMRWRWLCTGDCNIRIDLLLLSPFLILVSAASVVSLLWPGRASSSET